MTSTDRALTTYRWWCRPPFARSYSLKFLTVAFFGVHLPLIAFVAYVTVERGWREAWVDVLIVLTATLAGTGLTLWVQHRLLSPIRVTAGALRDYHDRREIAPLPVDLEDEAGELMRRTRECLGSLDGSLRLKDNLAAGIAHDFRNPLTGISLGAQILLADPTLSADHRTVVEQIQRTADAQLRLVQGLLEAVLDDTRNARFDLKAVALADVWHDVQATVDVVARQRGIALEFVPTTAVVAADRARLTQIVNNLASNALQATPAGGHVTISAESSGGDWVLHVRDTGRGLDAAHLLELLHQGTSQRAAAQRKTLGLGLRMVEAMLRLHASRLAVASQPGAGADFHFRLAAAA